MKLLTNLAIVSLILFGCGNKKETVKNDFAEFLVESSFSDYNLEFNFPKTFKSVREIDIENFKDTTNYNLIWLINQQLDNEDVFFFYDSTDTRIIVYVQAGPRIDISNEERDLTYFTVPTARINSIIPQESERRKMIYNSGSKKYKDRIYYNRRFKLLPEKAGQPDTLGYQDFYYITTKWQSVLVIINSPNLIDISKNVVGYKLVAKVKNAN